MPLRAFIALGLSLLALCQALPAAAAGDVDVAALQVALRARGLYDGAVDGVAGPRTGAAARSFQRHAGIAADGVAGPQTRAALGRRWRRSLGSRVLHQGKADWDVAALQFLLASRGFPSGPFDGGFGPRTEAAVMRFQRWARLSPDGVPGPATIAALRSARISSPIRLAWPIRAPLGDRFGPRGDPFHTGLDVPVPYGARISAAGSGRVVKAGWDAGAGGTWSSSGMDTACGRCMPTCRPSPSGAASMSPRARSWAGWGRQGPPRAPPPFRGAPARRRD